MIYAASDGRIDIVRLYKEWGATNFNEAMIHAARGGHIDIVWLYKEWGATNFDEAMRTAEVFGHMSKIRCALGFNKIHKEIFHYHHKKKHYKNLVKELFPITWHPDRAWDWCFDEDHKQTATILFENATTCT